MKSDASPVLVYYLLWSHHLQSRCSTNGVTGGGHVSFWVFQFCLHKSGVFLVIWLSVKRNKHVMCTLIFTNHINTVELVQSEIRVSDILWHPTKLYGPKVFLLTKIKPEYFDILYNPTHFPCTWVCRIRQVPLYSSLDTHHTYLVHYHYISLF